MKKLALLFALLASPAMAADTIGLAIGGGSGGACNAGNITAGNFTCSATITDPGGTWHTQLIATFQAPCAVANSGAVCTSVQVLAYIKTRIMQVLTADVQQYYQNLAVTTATAPVTLQ
jgi:hypothetical protein